VDGELGHDPVSSHKWTSASGGEFAEAPAAAAQPGSLFGAIAEAAWDCGAMRGRGRRLSALRVGARAALTANSLRSPPRDDLPIMALPSPPCISC
jgi:hypothetical protein